MASRADGSADVSLIPESLKGCPFLAEHIKDAPHPEQRSTVAAHVAHACHRLSCLKGGALGVALGEMVMRVCRTPSAMSGRSACGYEVRTPNAAMNDNKYDVMTV